ncbi:hypothetical protein LRQ11_22325 [Pseudomonas sp. MAFF 311095]|uniref:Abortive infection C-terminus n=1 Tax=Pseudomonas petroselini TaxID=2899822 RepID=A0ABS8QPY8_9PSED|nr:hypothetical protein [Pseudomonas petroselini]MCD7037736.1 hypothetical protein [Pseudomonas petroselini]MCD7043686.1 hypothetical protein [Pseudomonas petroselini]MCD7069519.1 hypothetical protein [Pseudomonas petroselini]MCD7081391.1 hypothetical protein [Pseudomonas petroselini]
MNKALKDLAVAGEKLRIERARVWDGIKAFEKILIEQAGELGFSAQSDVVILEEKFDQDDEQVAQIEGRLFFNGKRLVLFTEYYPEDHLNPEPTKHFLKDLSVHWLKRIGAPEVLHSVATALAVKMQSDVEDTRRVAEGLSRYLTVQRAKTNEDIYSELSDDFALLDLWTQCHDTVNTKPQNSIGHGTGLLESTFKRCLTKLGHTGHEDFDMGQSIGALNTVFFNKGLQKAYSGQLLAAAVKMCVSIGTTRNKVANVHGRDAGYVAPTEDLALLMSHLSGSLSVYIRKQVELVLESDKKP